MVDISALWSGLRLLDADLFVFWVFEHQQLLLVIFKKHF